MRAVVVHPPTPGATIVDVDPPALGPGLARVSVIEVGVCGTDHDIASGLYGVPPPGSPYLILGHENLGEVVEVAAGVTGLSPGDLVVATVRRGCGRCRFCRADRSDYCETGGFTERGIKQAHGYCTEQYVEEPRYLVRVPPELRPVAVLLEPLSVVEKAILVGQRVLDRKEPTPGQPRDRVPTALVAGTGAIGLLSALVLRLRGYEVIGIDRHDDTPEARLLELVGAVHRNAKDGLEVLGGRTFDLVLEATGAAGLDVGLVGTLGPNGVLVLTGIPNAAAPSMPVATGALFRAVVLGNQAIVGSVNANRTYFESGLRDMIVARERWPGFLEGILAGRRPLADAPRVLADRQAGTMKTVLTIRDNDL